MSPLSPFNSVSNEGPASLDWNKKKLVSRVEPPRNLPLTGGHALQAAGADGAQIPPPPPVQMDAHLLERQKHHNPCQISRAPFKLISLMLLRVNLTIANAHQIKQQELTARKSIVANPVQMDAIKRQLLEKARARAAKKAAKAAKKAAKKARKDKKRKRPVKESSSDSDSEASGAEGCPSSHSHSRACCVLQGSFSLPTLPTPFPPMAWCSFRISWLLPGEPSGKSSRMVALHSTWMVAVQSLVARIGDTVERMTLQD